MMCLPSCRMTAKFVAYGEILVRTRILWRRNLSTRIWVKIPRLLLDTWVLVPPLPIFVVLHQTPFLWCRLSREMISRGWRRRIRSTRRWGRNSNRKKMSKNYVSQAFTLILSQKNMAWDAMPGITERTDFRPTSNIYMLKHTYHIAHSIPQRNYLMKITTNLSEGLLTEISIGRWTLSGWRRFRSTRCTGMNVSRRGYGRPAIFEAHSWAQRWVDLDDAWKDLHPSCASFEYAELGASQIVIRSGSRWSFALMSASTVASLHGGIVAGICRRARAFVGSTAAVLWCPSQPYGDRYRICKDPASTIFTILAWNGQSHNSNVCADVQK